MWFETNHWITLLLSCQQVYFPTLVVDITCFHPWISWRSSCASAPLLSIQPMPKTQAVIPFPPWTEVLHTACIQLMPASTVMLSTNKCMTQGTTMSKLVRNKAPSYHPTTVNPQRLEHQEMPKTKSHLRVPAYTHHGHITHHVLAYTHRAHSWTTRHAV